MEKILLLVEDNLRYFLQEQLGQFYNIIIGALQDSYLPQFDLCITDYRNLLEIHQQLLKQKYHEKPAILPVLAVYEIQDENSFSEYMGKSIDELIITPIRKLELLTRIGILLRIRSLSILCIEQKKGSLQIAPLYSGYGKIDIDEKLKSNLLLQHKQYLLTEAQRLTHLGSWEYPIELAPLIIWSEEMFRIFHVDSKEFVPSVKKLLDFIHPEDRNAMQKWLDTTMKGNQAKTLDFRVILNDGTRKIIRGTGKPFFDENGKLAGAIGTAQDITEQKLTEDKLRRSEERFHGFFNLNTEYCFIVSPAGLIIDVNQIALKVLGYHYDELVGRSINSIYAQESKDTLDSLIVIWEQTGVIRNAELIVQTKNGAKHTVILNVTNQYNPDGSLNHIISIHHDITERKQAEQIIVQERNLSNHIIESLPGTFYLFDQNGHFLRWNKLLETITGFSSEEITRMSPVDFFQGSDRDLITDSIKRVFISGYGSVEANLVCKNGRVIPYYNTGNRVFYNDQLCILGMGIDITERKQIENALRESEERLRLFIEHAPVALAMFDHNMNYLAASQRWITDYRLENKQIIGKSHYELFPGLSEHLISAHHRGLKGEVVRNEEYRFVRSDGSAQYNRWEVRPWYTADGAVGGIVIFVEDITERKLAEKQLAAERERLSVTLRSIGDGVIAVDNDKNVILINKAAEELTGWTQKESFRRSLNEVFYALDAATKKRVELIEKNVKYGANLQLISRNGSKADIAHSFEPIIDNQGNVLGMVLVFRDITERRKHESNLKSSLHQKEVLLQELYHRTKNNMQVISALLELQAASSQNEEIERIVRDSQSRIRTMALAHEKLYRSKSLSRINMKDYITDLAKLLMTTYGGSTKKININFGIDDISVLIDIAIPCGLIITELLSNAIKHAFPENREGLIDIGLHQKDSNHLELTVSDNGIGIQPGIDIQKSSSLGIQLVNQITKHQLRGIIKVKSNGGLSWSIIFRSDIYSERV